MITLEQLQPYLDAGITVQTPAGQGHLAGLSCYGGMATAGVVLEGAPRAFHLQEVQPVLRPFEQLIAQLPSGEVALVEMARLAHGTWEPGVPDLHHEFGTQWALLPHATTAQFFNVPDHFLADGTISDRVARYLRSRHFAVGFEAGQFIPYP